jgi:hypothetical protein
VLFLDIVQGEGITFLLFVFHINISLIRNSLQKFNQIMIIIDKSTSSCFSNLISISLKIVKNDFYHKFKFKIDLS